MSAADQRFMALALSLGRRGQGNAWPNPAVGCVIVQGARIVGRGWTAPGGRPHAETQALAQAGPAARGATAYVTLEPCAHHGQTPPCAEALIAAGVARVVVALVDTDTRVSGRGLDMLRAAGIAVTTGVLAPQAAQDLAGFRLSRAQGRPWITLKLATSLDGRIATASGESKWITGPAARRAVHALRLCHDAVMIGAGTARADDPLLTVRDMGVRQQPVRVVISRRADLPEEGALARSCAQVPLWLCHGPDVDAARLARWSARGARLFECRLQDGQVDLGAAVSALAEAGLTRVFCEGGGTLAASLLSCGLVDELVGFTAGLAIGAEGTPAVGVMGLARLAEARRLDLVESRAVGADVMHRWRRTDPLWADIA